MKLKLFTFFLLFFQLSFSQLDSLIYYFKKGEYNKAINYGEKQKSLSKIKDNNYALLINNLASAYSFIGDVKNAELNYLEELELEKAFFGEKHKIVANTFRNIANTCSANNEYAKAENYFIKAIEIKRTVDGINHPEYSDYLLDLAVLYKDIKDFKSAENLYIGVCDLIKMNQGENSLSYQKAMVSTAIFYDEKGDFVKAEELYLKSYKLQKINLKTETLSDFIFTLDLIGKRYDNKLKYKEAQNFYFESLELKRQKFGIQNEEYINSLIDLGMSFSSQSNYLKSRYYFEEVNSIFKKLRKENSKENAFVLEALASGYRFEGKYEISEKLYYQLIEINKNVFTENSKEYVESLKLLAGNYSDKGDFKNAEKFYLKYINQIKDKNSYIYLIGIIELGNFYIDLQNPEKAFFYIKNVNLIFSEVKSNLREFDLIHYYILRVWQNYYIQIKDYKSAMTKAFEKIKFIETNPIFGSLSNAYSRDLCDVAMIFRYIGDYENSQKYYLKAYEISKDNIGQNPRNDSSLLLIIAILYDKNKNFNLAEQYYLQSIKMVEEKRITDIPFYDDILYYISTFYFKNLLPTKTAPNLNKALKKNNSDIIQAITFLSMNEFDYIRNEVYNKLNFPFSFLQSHPSQFPEINIARYENELLLKNLSLRNQQRIKNTIEKNGDASVKEKYHQFIDNKRFLTKLEELPIAQRPSEYQQLVADTEILEKELTRLSSTFADAKTSLAINWKQIQSKLKPNEIAIDLVHYNYYNKKWTDSIYYGAFIIKKDSKFPKYITLFEQKQLSKLLEKNKKENDTIQAKILNKQYTEKAISDLFFKPLEQELKNCKTIYLAPSGLAHQINFKALPIKDNQTFGEQFEIKFVSSTSSILDYKPTSFQEKKDLELILYGGIDYNKNSNEINKEENQNGFNDLATRSGIVEFNYLPGTNLEVEKINTEAKKYNFNTILKTEKNATEESIKQLDGKTTPFVLHLATHGFFFENIKQEKQDNFILMEENTKRKNYLSSEDPMMRSGLIFAGANKFWGKSNEESLTEDGILTAKEISNLDLSNCQLVVLSACETGLGQINGSEGVFGLQRAFKMAGVKNIIMSLWKVPDAQTAELFELFYSECFSGKSIQEAFQSTQAKMKAKYSPYYWAGFILLE
jgi:CHAT domain-containing protein